MPGRRFRLRIGLQLPPGSKGKYLEAGTEATEDELPGLNVDHLVTANFLDELPSDPIRCPACEESGTAADKKKRYDTSADLSAHYAAEHPALAAPAEEA